MNKPYRYLLATVVVLLAACASSQTSVNSAPPATQPIATSEPAPAPVASDDAAVVPSTDAMATATAPQLPDAAMHTTAAHDGGAHTATTASTAAAHEPVAMAAGEAVFNRVCNRCHHASRAETDVRITGEVRSEQDVRMVVRGGHGRMRALTTAQLSDPELAEVIAYMRTVLHAVR